MSAKFLLGALHSTTGALAELTQDDILNGLRRHLQGDWGDLDADDRQANELALLEGNRLVSRYHAVNGTTFYIITEWDRSLTTVLLPQEY